MASKILYTVSENFLGPKSGLKMQTPLVCRRGGGYIWVAAAGDLMLLFQAWHRTPAHQYPAVLSSPHIVDSGHLHQQ